MAGTVLNDAKGQGKGTFDIAVNLAAGKDPVEGTGLTLENRVLLVPSIGIDKTNVAEYK